MFVRVPQAHTSENICAFLKEVANEWNIDKKIVAIVTDNASNMKLAVTLGGWKPVSCFAHTLNLAVTDALKNNSELNGILARCRSLVAFFKQPSKANSQFKKNGCFVKNIYNYFKARSSDALELHCYYVKKYC